LRAPASAIIFIIFLGQGASAVAGSREASRLFIAGRALFERGRYEDALRVFEQSNKNRAHYRTAYAMAQAHRLLFAQSQEFEHLQRAVELYERFLRQAPASSPFRVMADTQVKRLSLTAARLRLTSATQPAKPPETPTQLMITSRTPGARVTIDGEPQDGDSVPAMRDVRPGEHRVVVTAPDHQRVEHTLVAVKGRLVTSHLDLDPLPGTARVRSHPDGAAVTIDGDAVGLTPLDHGGLRPGWHDLVISHRGRRLWRDRLQIASGRSTTAVADMKWSTQRKAAWATAGAGAAMALAGMVTGLLALGQDSALDTPPSPTDEDRQVWDDKLATRDRLGLSSTILLSSAGAALAVAAVLYWFDRPEPR